MILFDIDLAWSSRAHVLIESQLKNDWIYILTFAVSDSIDTVVLHVQAA